MHEKVFECSFKLCLFNCNAWVKVWPHSSQTHSWWPLIWNFRSLLLEKILPHFSQSSFSGTIPVSRSSLICCAFILHSYQENMLNNYEIMWKHPKCDKNCIYCRFYVQYSFYRSSNVCHYSYWLMLFITKGCKMQWGPLASSYLPLLLA